MPLHFYLKCLCKFEMNHTREPQTHTAKPDYSFTVSAPPSKQRLVPAQGKPGNRDCPFCTYAELNIAEKTLKALSVCILLDKSLHKVALLNTLSTSPCTEFFLSAPRKEQAYISLTTRAVTTPAPLSHPSVQRGTNQLRLQWSARINAAWWEERTKLKVCQSRRH